MAKATANLPHRYKTICPVCGKVSAFAAAEAITEINCGDCLMDRAGRESQPTRPEALALCDGRDIEDGVTAFARALA
jgi:hypothetical protein